jgi:aminopeptidase YwaD
MNKLTYLLIIFICLMSSPALAQKAVRDWLAKRADTLCSPVMAGRGYVNDGRLKAANYVEQQFRSFELQPPSSTGSYLQTYSFPVNSFPDHAELEINGSKLIPGVDFLVDAGSSTFVSKKQKIQEIDLAEIKDKAGWNATKLLLNDKKYIYYLENADTLCKKLSIHSRHFADELPSGCFILPQHGKLTWTVNTTTIHATVFYVEDTVLPNKLKSAKANLHAEFVPSAKSENVIGIVPGQIDSYVVFTAHHDHLGMMGSEALFPGASDNASGTATLLYLAKYFAEHPSYYTVVFISFSGEEAGLLGSDYFVKHPEIPLDRIHFLINLDIMGDAAPGVTVVNATEYPQEFELLKQLNDQHNYLPEIKSRGKAANSDHYNFSEHGVPSFFIYSNGGKGYYHDVLDKASALTFNNIDNLITLLIAFTGKL